jgi:hypothetical protein
MTFPYKPYDQNDARPEPGSARTVNLLIPVSLPGCRVSVHVELPEAGARQIANLSPDTASALGEFFVLIRNGIDSFLREEG